jgi:hypothetical protein
MLPICSDMKIYPIYTTNQINTLEHVGLINYFRPYKRTQKTLSGDFYIATKLSFDDLNDHPAFNTWLMHNGYNITHNTCQTANMEKISFLSRVRGFTLRGDLQAYIVKSAEWNANPFQFRMYFDAFSAKGKTADVLMVDVDRPNIDIGMLFFQQWFKGTLPNSPNNIPYMFWPFNKKAYAEEERIKIIIDNNHHLGTDSVLAIRGLHPLESLVQLINGKHTMIPAPGTVTGKLFVQVERQLTSDWLLCCFHLQDANKVTLRLSSLEESLKRYTHPDSHGSLFLTAEGLSFTGQVAPLTKGRNRLPRMEVPAQTASYVHQSMQRIYHPTPNRLATEMEPTPVAQATTTAMPTFREKPTSYAAVAVITPTPAFAQNGAQSEAHHLHELQATTKLHSSTLMNLKECCVTLVTTRQHLAANMAAMITDMNKKFTELVEANQNFHQRFDTLTKAIDNLSISQEDLL